MSRIKAFLKAHPSLLRAFFACFNVLPFNNTVKNKRCNKIVVKGLMKRCKIKFHGKNNTVEIRERALLNNCTINVSGNNNHVIFGAGTYANMADLCTEDDNNRIVIGDKTSLCGQIHLAAIEGTSINIGEDCLFSSGIVFRTGDSHSILDMEGNRTNPSQDINIGNHVWVGHRVLINKGVSIGENNIIGTGAIVTKSITDTNSVIAGVPAKVVKTGVNWDGQRK